MQRDMSREMNEKNLPTLIVMRRVSMRFHSMCNTRKYHDVLTSGNVLLIFVLAATTLTNPLLVIMPNSKQYLISMIESSGFYVNYV